MSKHKLKYRWGPACNFMDEALGAHDFSKTQHAVLYVIKRKTFGEKDYSRPGYQLESARISYTEFARCTGRAVAGIRKALAELEQANVIIIYSGAANELAKEYGINTRIDEWTISRIGQMDAKSYPSKTSTGATQVAPKTRKREQAFTATQVAPKTQKVAPQVQKSSTPDRREPLQDKAPLATVEVFRSIDPPIVPQGTVSGDCFQKIETVDQALASQNISVEDASEHAAELYRQRYGQRPTRHEERKLDDYFRASDFRGTLLALWIGALSAAYRDREERRQDPAARKYVSRSAFRDVLTFATNEFANRQARKRQLDQSERLAAATHQNPTLERRPHDPVTPLPRPADRRHRPLLRLRDCQDQRAG